MVNNALLVVAKTVVAVGQTTLLEVDIGDFCVLAVEDTSDFLESGATDVELASAVFENDV